MVDESAAIAGPVTCQVHERDVSNKSVARVREGQGLSQVALKPN